MKTDSGYITVYQSISGWKAVLLTWEPEFGGWEPYSTGIGAYASKEDAIAEARDWAESEGLNFVEK